MNEDTKKQLAEDIAFALRQKTHFLKVKSIPEERVAADARAIVEQIELSNWVVFRGAPGRSVRGSEAESELSLAGEIARETIARMERDLWVHDKGSGEDVCPLKNYVDWINLVEIVRGRVR